MSNNILNISIYYLFLMSLALMVFRTLSLFLMVRKVINSKVRSCRLKNARRRIIRRRKPYIISSKVKLSISASSKLDKEFNPSNIPRNINTKVRKPMDQRIEYKRIYLKADPKLYDPRHRILDPLFLLKLHSRLRELPQHLDIFCKLTNDAIQYVQESIEFIANNWQKITNFELCDRKFKALQRMINYLRDTSIPTKMKLEDYVKFGIYGVRKAKYNKKVEATIIKCIEMHNGSRQGLKAKSI